MKRTKTVCYNGVHTHTHPQILSSLQFLPKLSQVLPESLAVTFRVRYDFVFFILMIIRSWWSHHVPLYDPLIHFMCVVSLPCHQAAVQVPQGLPQALLILARQNAHKLRQLLSRGVAQGAGGAGAHESRSKILSQKEIKRTVLVADCFTLQVLRVGTCTRTYARAYTRVGPLCAHKASCSYPWDLRKPRKHYLAT